jgi:hypothetical protein
MAVLTSTHHGMRRRSLLALACCTAFSVGCYRYAPVPVESLTPDMSVRLELSAVAVDRLRRGPDSLARLVDGFTVSGTVSQLRGDSVLLAVPMSFMEANVRLRTQMHDLPILRSDVQGVTSRRLDRARTTWAGVAIGVVAAGATAGTRPARAPSPRTRRRSGCTRSGSLVRAIKGSDPLIGPLIA